MTDADPVIGTVTLACGGRIGLTAMPGCSGDFAGDLQRMFSWKPDFVVSLAEVAELTKAGAGAFEADLRNAGIAWAHFPISDFGTPQPAQADDWARLSASLLQRLSARGSVLLHCQAGLGRSGMIALRLMLDAGENPDDALARLRAARPGAVETDAQLAWATT